MDYHVILIECGRPTHHWLYHDVHTAIMQVERLNNAFQECNEVYATFIKAGFPDRGKMPDQLIQEMIVPPPLE